MHTFAPAAVLYLRYACIAANAAAIPQQSRWCEITVLALASMLPWPAGDAFWNLVSITPVHDTAGKVMSFIGVHSDITELVRRREAEKELQEAKVPADAEQPFCSARYVCCGRICIDMQNTRVPASLCQRLSGLLCQKLLSCHVCCLLPSDVDSSHSAKPG